MQPIIEQLLITVATQVAGEYSKSKFWRIVIPSGIVVLFPIVVGGLYTTLPELWLRAPQQWQSYQWFFLTFLTLLGAFLLIRLSVKLHTIYLRNRDFYLFEYGEYQWKILLPSRELESQIPNCLTHRTSLSINTDDAKMKCPHCETSISAHNYEYMPIASTALRIGISKLDGHYRPPKK